MLRLEKVTKHFGGLVALKNVSFEVTEGQIFSLIGPNGSGKTTLFNVITRLLPITKGAIYYKGIPLNKKKADQVYRLGIGRTFQEVSLFQNLSVLENVMVAGYYLGHSRIWDTFLYLPRERSERKEAQEQAEQLLDLTGLYTDRDMDVRNLPFGKRKLLEISRALAADPGLILLDEPVAGLNPRETQYVAELILKMRNDMGKTILVIEHVIDLVMGISDRIAVLNFGEKIAEGMPKEIQNNPNVISAYLG